VLPDSRVDLVRSPVAIAVREGAPLPDVSSEDRLRRAVLAASSLGYSTGPSGTALLKPCLHAGASPSSCANASSRPPMIIDTIHGHYTTAPQGAGRLAQPPDRRHQGSVAMPKVAELKISDDECARRSKPTS
jgi:hypothetical protein